MDCNMMKEGIITAGSKYTAQAGADILKAGGNAFDAALGAMLMSCVAEPALTSAAGGGFMLTREGGSGRKLLFDFFAQTPQIKSKTGGLDFYPIEFNYGDAIQTFHIGLGSVAVPGFLRGVFHIHERLGRMPMEELARPAIDAAREGLVVTEHMHYCMNLVKPVIEASPRGREIFADSGEMKKPGMYVRLDRFADALDHLSREGDDEFYRGSMGQKLVRDAREKGGHIRMDDLENYQVLEREPLSHYYRHYRVFTNPPPSSGGTLIAFLLKMIEKLDCEKAGFGKHKHLSMLANAMKTTAAARKKGFDGKIHEKGVAKNFLGKAFMREYERQMYELSQKTGNTTHLSVADKAGNIATVTTSHGEGSGYMIPGTDIMCNNMLGEEDLNPGGFHQWPEDTRITSMMAPTLVEQNQKPILALGTGGANRIRSAIAQVIINHLDFGMPIEKAVEAPRLHWDAGRLDVEHGFARAEVEKIQIGDTQIVPWSAKAMFFGGTHCLALDSTGQLSGAGDSRRAGTVIVV
jgi:gamma-glutamyltranspeptidase/glutathione hydrolase